MIKKFAPLFAVVILFAVETVQSQTALLTGAEIEAALSGNTITGTWSGSDYRQFFAANGSTTYAPRNSPPTQGRWRIDHDQGLYESWWQQSGWSAYKVKRDDGQLFWVNEQGANPQPFSVQTGKHMRWE